MRVIPKKNILDYVELYKQSLPEKFPTCLSRISPVIVCFDEYLVGNIMVMVCMWYCYKEVNALAPNSDLDTEADRGGVW